AKKTTQAATAKAKEKVTTLKKVGKKKVVAGIKTATKTGKKTKSQAKKIAKKTGTAVGKAVGKALGTAERLINKAIRVAKDP
ncbi:MAG: hypothetical protein ACPGYT_06565, partial [Nitrospirales bacterium]